MDKLKEKIIKIISDNKNITDEELAEKIVAECIPDNIIGCFSAKEIGEVYSLGREHQKHLKEGQSGLSEDDIIKIWTRADELHKSIIWE